MAYIALGFNKRFVTNTSTSVPSDTSPSHGTAWSTILANPHCSSIAPTRGSAPTTCVSTRVRASMLRLLGDREMIPQIAKNAKTAPSCPYQPSRWGAEREEFARIPVDVGRNSCEFRYTAVNRALADARPEKPRISDRLIQFRA